MFGQKPQPAPILIQSPWWERLASFTAEMRDKQTPHHEEAELDSLPTATWRERNRKRGFRLNVRRPLLFSRRINTP